MGAGHHGVALAPRTGAVIGGIGLRQGAHDLTNGQQTGTGCADTADLHRGVGFGRVGEAQGFTHHRTVMQHVAHGQQAGVVGVLLHLVHHALRQGALVEGIRAFFGNQLEGLRQARVFQHPTDRERLAVGLVKVGRSLGVLAQSTVCQQQGVQAWRDFEALFSQGDGGLEQLGPRQFAMLLVGFFQHAQGAGHAHGTATHGGFIKRHGLTVVEHEDFFMGQVGRGFAAIKSLQFAAVVVQQERTAANAAGLRFHQGEHHLHRNGGVHRRATRFQNVVARLGSQGVGRGHTACLEGPTGFGLVTTRGFWLCCGDVCIAELGLRGTGQQQAAHEHAQAEGAPLARCCSEGLGGVLGHEVVLISGVNELRRPSE